MPEEAANLDAIGKVLGIALVKSFADWQPHVNENEHAGENVSSMQAGDCEIAREIRAVPRAERIDPLNVLPVYLCNLVSE